MKSIILKFKYDLKEKNVLVNIRTYIEEMQKILSYFHFLTS